MRHAALRAVAAAAFCAAIAGSGLAKEVTPPPPAADEPARIAEFETTLDAAFATGDFVGLAVAVVSGGETTLLKTYGVTDAAGTQVVEPGTVFRIASLSKGIASSLAGIAFAEGRLSVDNSAARYAPGFALMGGAEASLTLGHVMSHRSGLPPYAYDNLLEEGVPIDDILPRYADVSLACPVGRCYAYQNIVFDFISRALSSVYGKPYADIVEEKLFGPLGMTTASVSETGLKESASWARPHSRDRKKGSTAYGPWRAVPVKAAYYKTPASGGVNASILDMAEWLKAQMGLRPEVLSPATLALIHAPQVSTPPETARIRPVSTRFGATQYGYGWRIYSYEGRKLITHSGTVDGYAAQIAFLPESGVGIVILSNARSRRVWRIVPTFLDIELGLTREDWLALNDGAAVGAGTP